MSSIRVAQTPPHAPSLSSAPSTLLRLPPPLLPLESIPPQRLSILRRASSTVLGVPVPRDFQLVAAHHLAFNRDTLLVVNRRTADGKTLAATLPAFLRRGVGVFLVPLVGLGSDQVERATVIDHSIQPYHLDEHKGEDAALLITRLRLLTVEESKWVTIKLFLGPKALSSQKWGPVLERLARKGVISLFCIDEAHEVEQSGRFFRPEFKAAVAAIPRLVKIMPKPVPRVLLSATLRQRDVDVCAQLLGDMRPNVLAGPLDRRSIKVTVHISGDSASSLKNSAKRDFAVSPYHQQIWYTHSRSNAEGALLTAAQTILEKHHLLGGGPHSIAQAFVGTDGIMMKTTTMDAIKMYDDLSGEGTVLDPSSYRSIIGSTSSTDDVVELPKVQCVVATKSAQAGINGVWLKYAKKKGLPSTMYEFSQEMGRVDRGLDAEPGSNTYEVHADANSYLSFFIRTMSCSDAQERKQQLTAHHLVMQSLLTPTECYHVCLEKYFELTPLPNKEPCGHYCSKCLGRVPSFTGRVNKLQLISFLAGKVCGQGMTPSMADFIKAMKKDRQSIFHKDDVTKTMEQIHALVLQLFSKGVVELAVLDKTKIGTDKLHKEHLFVKTMMAKKGGVVLPASMFPNSWSGLNVC
jgi:superfamily II DNA helicase RecQ